MTYFRRKTIGHSVPEWVPHGSVYFITICCEKRKESDLTQPFVSTALLDSIRFYHERQNWCCRLALLMPDHLHLLAAFQRDSGMVDTIGNWKKYVSRSFGVKWQRNFFEHRIRNDENWELKADYIRQNPVRKGLVARAEDWPYVFEA